MSESNLEVLEEHLFGDDGLMIKLRMGKGYDQGKFEEVCIALRECAKEWAKNDSIPKSAVALLIGISPAFFSVLEYYDKNVVDKINLAEATIQDIIFEEILG